MIVCSLPRCGATRFCLDLQEKSGLPFVGELHPIHIESDRKAQTHETGFQTNFAPSDFADLLHDHSKHIVLVNQHSYLLAWLLSVGSFFPWQQHRGCSWLGYVQLLPAGPTQEALDPMGTWV